MLSVGALATALAGCSFAELKIKHTQTPQQCPWGYVAIDASVGAAAVLVGSYLVASADAGYSEWTGLPRDPERSIGGRALVGAGVVGLVSAAYGWDMTRRCERHNLELEQQRVQRDNMLAQRERAWIITRDAAAAARGGDCNKVIELSAQVRGVDAEFHATVFRRDVAIEKCLALLSTEPSAATP